MRDMATRMAGPIARVLNALPEEERDRAWQTVLGRKAPYRQEDGSYRMPSSNWGVVAS